MGKDSNPLISVIVPCFNHAHFLPETLESVIAQTYKHWECIVVDDGSTDDTKKVVEQYGRRDKRIRSIYKENGGLSSARNEGLSHYKGDYVQFLDSDDKISERKFENQIHIFKECTNADLVYAGVKYFTSNKPNEISWVNIADPSGKLQESAPGMEILNSLIRQNAFVVNAPLIKRSAIEKIGFFDTELKSVEDWDYWLRGALAGVFFKYDDNEDSCALVRVHKASMSTNVQRMVAASIMVREKLDKRLAAIENNKEIDGLRRLNKIIMRDLQRRLQDSGNTVSGLIGKKIRTMKLIRLLADSLRKIMQ